MTNNLSCLLSGVKHEGRVSKNLDYLCEVNDVILFYDKYQELWKINVKIKMFT